MTAYNHNEKAGNQGDIIKHATLIAALMNGEVASKSNTFVYDDLFAGYGSNPLSSISAKHGIGSIVNSKNKAQSKAVQKYLDLFEPSKLLDESYPGSSLIAYNILHEIGFSDVHMNLYDISESVIQNLKDIYKNTSNVNINHQPATKSNLNSSDFIFIDPPGLKSKENIQYPDESTVIEMGLSAKNALIWMPLTISTAQKPPSISKRSQDFIVKLNDAGFDVTQVQWAKGGRTVGCYMAYNLSDKATSAVKQAIEDIVSLTKWGNILEKNPVSHFKAST